MRRAPWRGAVRCARPLCRQCARGRSNDRIRPAASIHRRSHKRDRWRRRFRRHQVASSGSTPSRHGGFAESTPPSAVGTGGFVPSLPMTTCTSRAAPHLFRHYLHGIRATFRRDLVKSRLTRRSVWSVTTICICSPRLGPAATVCIIRFAFGVNSPGPKNTKRDCGATASVGPS